MLSFRPLESYTERIAMWLADVGRGRLVGVTRAVHVQVRDVAQRRHLRGSREVGDVPPELCRICRHHLEVPHTMWQIVPSERLRLSSKLPIVETPLSKLKLPPCKISKPNVPGCRNTPKHTLIHPKDSAKSQTQSTRMHDAPRVPPRPAGGSGRPRQRRWSRASRCSSPGCARAPPRAPAGRESRCSHRLCFTSQTQIGYWNPVYAPLAAQENVP